MGLLYIFVYNILRSISDCLSEEEPSPWIALDFGKRVTVQRVDIFNGKYAIEPTASIEVHISDEIPGRIFVERMPLMGRFDGPATAGQHIIIPGQTNTFLLATNTECRYEFLRFRKSDLVWQICGSPAEK